MYPPSAMFAALLLMYLKELRSVLGPIRFLSSNPVWLRALGLRRVGGVEVHSVPDRTRFYRLARRIGVDGMMRILSVMVVRLMQRGVIRAKSVSLDATIISAWSKDCRSRKDEQHLKTCRHEVSKDRDASWGYDHHRDGYVCGYKVHVLMDSETALPILLTVTNAGYGETRTVPWFVSMLLLLSARLRKFFADMGVRQQPGQAPRRAEAEGGPLHLPADQGRQGLHPGREEGEEEAPLPSIPPEELHPSLLGGPRLEEVRQGVRRPDLLGAGLLSGEGLPGPGLPDAQGEGVGHAPLGGDMRGHAGVGEHRPGRRETRPHQARQTHQGIGGELRTALGQPMPK
ncbi:MAG: transposase [Nitrososphaerota archaeon]|nr:transposase [Nitrososphaerota archaeon]MDG6916849.1 transposase [Nitrososphaerota archaeon]